MRKKQILLKDYLTMNIGGQAMMIDFYTKEELIEAVAYAKERGQKIFVLGGGSNTLAPDQGFHGIILRNCMQGLEITESDDQSVLFTIAGGESLDTICAKSVEMGLSGIESLSGIPGTAGAAPVQNVGAYGQEISDSLLSLEAYDLKQDRFVTLSNEECHFGYRTSIFRGKDWGRYIITSITVKLSKELPQPPFYQAIENVLQKEGISTYTSALIREIVLRIRDSKLPDPACIPNSGSFFKNAIVSQSQFDHISTLESHVPHYQIDASTYKIPTGWLIDKSGLKGSILHGIKVHDQNALILTNIAANSYHNLALAREEIIDIVHQKFGITIEQEVLEIR